MNKVINGRRYNTETAQLMGEWDNRQYGQFGYCAETLYRKRSGEYFLHGVGGPMSQYRKYSGDNNWSGGEDIIPMSAPDAREWAEKHLDGDAYESIFGAVSEDAEDVYLSFKVDAETNAKLRSEASYRGISLTEMLRDMVRML